MGSNLEGCGDQCNKKKGISYEMAFSLALKGFAHHPKRIMITCVNKESVESVEVTQASHEEIINLIERFKDG